MLYEVITSIIAGPVFGLHSITQFQQYYAIGSGAGYALGALHALYGDHSPTETARRAVQAAIDLDIYCGGEINTHSYNFV